MYLKSIDISLLHLTHLMPFLSSRPTHTPASVEHLSQVTTHLQDVGPRSDYVNDSNATIQKTSIQMNAFMDAVSHVHLIVYIWATDTLPISI
jgi:hypothetical protein